jgi:RHS repeat-associated protein
MVQPGRKYTIDSYRYGFNGKENDNEVKGEGNQQDYGMRFYDPRIAKFISIDPLAKKFPYLSPFQYAANKPIWCIDIDGLEDLPYTDKNKYGEKQIYNTFNDVIDGNSIITYTVENIPTYAKAATSGLTDVEVYQFAFNRFAEPGMHLIKPNEYIDKRLMLADQQVEYFFTHQVPSYSKSNVASRNIHAIIAASLFHGDNKEDAVKQIQKSDDFSYRHSWGNIIVAAAPLATSLNIRKALSTFAKIESRNIQLLENSFKSGWATGDLTASIEKFVGKNASFEVTESGKVIWKSENSTIQVIQDPMNKYFTISDTKITGRRAYLDLDGNIPNNKTLNGKQVGRTQDEYNQATHFNY